jgi:hypothetical protein
MRQCRPDITIGHEWDPTREAYGDPSPDTRGESQTHAERLPLISSSRRASYEPQPLRELLKPILDELQDKLERFEGEPTPADHRWLRGQLRKLVDRLDPWNG